MTARRFLSITEWDSEPDRGEQAPAPSAWDEFIDWCDAHPRVAIGVGAAFLAWAVGFAVLAVLFQEGWL